MSQIFNLPDVGEGLTEAEILAWKVTEGASIAVNDVLVEIETAKSVVELPSPYSGTVEKLLVAEGDTVEVGTPIIAISGDEDTDGESDTPDGAAEAGRSDLPEHVHYEPETRASRRDRVDEVENNNAADKALVGSGPKADPVKRRARKRTATGQIIGRAADRNNTVSGAAKPSTQPAAVSPQPVAHTPAEPGRNQGLLSEWAERASKFVENTPLNTPLNTVRQRLVGTAVASGTSVAHPVPYRPALAAPPVRLAAKEMGVDLADVTATGARGQVTKQDLLNYVAHVNDVQQDTGRFWQGPDTAGDRIERIPVRGVRKATAKAMVSSAFSAPHVSIFVDVDASRTMEFVKRLKKSRHFEGIKVTPLLVLAAAVVWAAERNPQVNATWTDSEILIKHYMNLGIAAATPRGLMVPNIKDAQEMSLRELAIALNNLTTRAREGKTQPSEMANGTLTITNIGSLGIDTGTPIINPGEVAIIAFGTIKQKPWVVDGEVIPRWVTTLGGSFDHRVVDGDLSARFMADVAAILEEPAMLLDI